MDAAYLHELKDSKRREWTSARRSEERQRSSLSAERVGEIAVRASVRRNRGR